MRVVGDMVLTFEHDEKLVEIKVSKAVMVLTRHKTFEKQEGQEEKEVIAFEVMLPGISPAAVVIGEAAKEVADVSTI